MTGIAPKPPTLAQIRKWPPTVDVPQAATALGISRSTLYEWIRTGQAPVQTLSVRHRYRVLTWSILNVLNAPPEDPSPRQKSEAQLRQEIEDAVGEVRTALLRQFGLPGNGETARPSRA